MISNEPISDLDLSVLRHIVARQIEDGATSDGHGWLYKKIHGLSAETIRKKQIVGSRDCAGRLKASGSWPEVQVGFWVISQDLADLGITTTEVAGALFIVSTTAFSKAAGHGAFGTTVQGFHEAHSRVSQYKVSMPSGGILGRIAMRYTEVALREHGGKAAEWALATRRILTCGAVAISDAGDDKFFFLRRYAPFEFHEIMMTAHRAGYRGGPEYSLKFVRAISKGELWQYDSSSRKVSKMADAAMLAHLQ